jgi:FkbM family methyltransferase
MEKVFGRHRIVADINYGLKVAVDKRCLVQRELLYKGTFEQEVLEILKSEIDSNDVFYDIGANVGLHSCVALKAGAAQAVLFEPDQLNSSVARLNLQLNGFANFVLLELALDDMQCKRTFFGASPDNTGTGGFSRVDRARSFLVPAERLDDVVVKYALPHPTILKVDVEGWEYSVLKGARQLLQGLPPRLIIFESDVDAHGIALNRELMTYLSEFDFNVEDMPRSILCGKANFIARPRSKGAGKLR